MRTKILNSIFFISLGFTLGGVAYKYIAQNRVETMLEEMARDEWVDAGNYLAIAKAIRDRRYDEALKFSESMVEIKVDTFSNKYSSLSKYETSTLRKINHYKKEDCSMNCLPSIK